MIDFKVKDFFVDNIDNLKPYEILLLASILAATGHKMSNKEINCFNKEMKNYLRDAASFSLGVLIYNTLEPLKEFILNAIKEANDENKERKDF